MGKIGNYIYLTWSNFEQGLKTQNYDALQQKYANKIFADKIKVIQQSFKQGQNDKAKAQQLEDSYNLILYGITTDKVDAETMKQIQQAREQLHNQVLDTLRSKYTPNIQVDDNLKVTLLGGSKFNLVKELTTKNINQFEHLINDAERLYKEIDIELKKITKASDKINKIREAFYNGQILNKIDDLRKLYENNKIKELSGTKTQIRTMNIDGKEKKFYSTLDAIVKKSDKKIRLFGQPNQNQEIGFITELNNIARALSVISNEAIGDALEIALANIPDMLTNQLHHDLGVIESAITGGKEDATKTGISSEFFSSSASIKMVLGIKDESKKIIKSKTIQGANNKIIITNNAVQGKTDVQYTFLDGTIANISAKNYNMSKNSNRDLGIVSKSPFLAMIQNENSNPTDYVNYYLNVAGKKYPNVNNKNFSSITDKHLLERAYFSMKLLLFAKGLFEYNVYRLDDNNDVISGQNVDYFVVNDSSGENKVKVLSTKAIFNFLISQQKNFDNFIDFEPKIDNLSWSNIPIQSSVQDRLNKILTAMYQDKITIHIRKAQWETLISKSK